MNLFRKYLAVLVFGFALPGLASAAEQSAVEAVEVAVEQLLDKVVEIKPYYSDERERYYEELQSSVEEFVDFREVAVGVMAQHSRQASEDQLQRFGEKLKRTLTRFYGSALVGYEGGQTLEYRAGNDTGNPRTATVAMRISGDGQPIVLRYAMFLDESDTWKLRNVEVGGINLRRQYSSQFDAYMMRYDNDIDQVIENWS